VLGVDERREAAAVDNLPGAAVRWRRRRVVARHAVRHRLLQRAVAGEAAESGRSVVVATGVHLGEQQPL